METPEIPIQESLTSALEHHRAGRLTAAEAIYRRILAAAGDVAEVLNNLSLILQQTGRNAEAEDLLLRAIARNPAFAEAHSNLGNLLQGLGRATEAEKVLRRAVALKPRYAGALSNLGIVLHHGGQLEEAVSCFRLALVEDAASPAVLSNLALALESLGLRAEAEASCRRAISLDPGNAAAYCNLGLVLLRDGRLADSEAAFLRARELDPGNTEAGAQWLHVSQSLCAWSADLDRVGDGVLDLVRGGRAGRIQPFIVLALSRSTPQDQLGNARQFAITKHGGVLESPPVAAWRPDSKRAKLRIGYLSADFHAHATSQLLASIIEHHERGRIESIGYSFGPDTTDLLGQRMRAAFDRFRDIRHMSHDASAHQMAEDEVDILVDLKGYTSGERSEILARRPAPVQVNWLGYPGTLGHSRLADYLIGDRVVTPLERAGDFAERIAQMPGCYQPSERKQGAGVPFTREQAGLPGDAFVFCCLNQSYKISPATFDLWCQLVRSVQGSLLWLLESTPPAMDNLRREAVARGVDASRIVFAPMLPRDRHLERLGLADLAIDTFPVTSHTSASDVLASGVPLVTRIGETFASRVAASILTTCELPELVAQDSESFVRLAKDLSASSAKLRAIRQKLDSHRSNGRLFDSRRFARELEDLYFRMWENHEAGVVAHLAAVSA